MHQGQNSISFATGRANTSKFKIVFVGDQSVGKTSIINSFIRDEFDAGHNPTVGIDFISKNLSIKGRTVRLQLWDTAGQERFRSLIPSYLKDSDAAFIVFDVTNLSSFEALSKWLDFVRESRGNDTLLYVLGNKSDLENQRTVSQERIEEFMKAEGLRYTEVSAKTRHNLGETFRNLCSILLDSPLEEVDINQSVVRGLNAPNKSTPGVANQNLKGKGPGGESKENNPRINPQTSKDKGTTVLHNKPGTQPQRTRSNCC